MQARLHGKNIIEHLLFAQEMDKQKATHYHFDSPLWRAIRDHIAYDADPALIRKEDATVRHHRGGGPAVKPRNVHVFGPDRSKTPPQDATTFDLEILVTYLNFESEEEYDREYVIRVPTDLEINFSKEKFDTWVNVQRTKRAKEKKKRDIEKLRNLISRYKAYAVAYINDEEPDVET